jgi:lysozyme family protein
MITPKDFLKLVISTWEGLYGDDPDDAGNWSSGQRGVGRLLGTMRGVTPAALAAWRGVSVDTITVETMKGLTLDEAADIGEGMFYKAPHFDLLTWCPATAALLDFGWGAGAAQAARSVQRLLGVPSDGVIGPVTAKAYNEWVASEGEEAAAQAIYDMRVAFYRQIASKNPVLQKYLVGWTNRARWVLKEAA